MIVIDEKTYVENVLEQNELPQAMHIKKFIYLLAKYYYPTHNESQIGLVRKIQEALDGFDLPVWRYNPIECTSYIKSTVRKMYHKEIPCEIRHPDSVIITKPELEIIQKAFTDNAKKVLTALYVLAKIATKPTGWVGYKRHDIFNLANVKVTRRERNKIIYELQKAKLIKLSEYVDNTSVMVKLIPGDTAFEVTDFEHIGNTYIDKYKDGWNMCQGCGRLIRQKKTGGRPKKYCKECAEKIHKKQMQQTNKLRRKRNKNQKSANP